MSDPFRVKGDMFFDNGLLSLSTLFKPIDAEIKKQHDFIVNFRDASHGDVVEFFVGSGLVAAQTYIREITCAFGLKNMEDAGEKFTLPPYVNEDVSYVQAINAAANYWKHASEWVGGFDTTSKQAKRSIDIIDKLIGRDADFLCCEILFLLVKGKEFQLSSLFEPLAEWRNNLIIDLEVNVDDYIGAL